MIDTYINKHINLLHFYDTEYIDYFEDEIIRNEMCISIIT